MKPGTPSPRAIRLFTTSAPRSFAVPFGLTAWDDSTHDAIAIVVETVREASYTGLEKLVEQIPAADTLDAHTLVVVLEKPGGLTRSLRRFFGRNPHDDVSVALRASGLLIRGYRHIQAAPDLRTDHNVVWGYST